MLRGAPKLAPKTLASLTFLRQARNFQISNFPQTPTNTSSLFWFQTSDFLRISFPDLFSYLITIIISFWLIPLGRVVGVDNQLKRKIGGGIISFLKKLFLSVVIFLSVIISLYQLSSLRISGNSSIFASKFRFSKTNRNVSLLLLCLANHKSYLSYHKVVISTNITRFSVCIHKSFNHIILHFRQFSFLSLPYQLSSRCRSQCNKWAFMSDSFYHSW